MTPYTTSGLGECWWGKITWLKSWDEVARSQGYNLQSDSLQDERSILLPTEEFSLLYQDRDTQHCTDMS